MSPFLISKSNKSFPVKVKTFISELDFKLDYKSNGQFLFDLVCRTIGLREPWYFGLQYNDSKNNCTWLKMNKKGNYRLMNDY